MSKKYCDWCHDPATHSVTLDNIKGRLCENCTAEAETEFTHLTISKDAPV